MRHCDTHLYTEADTTADVSVFLEITHVDIISYLVFSANIVTLEQMKA